MLDELAAATHSVDEISEMVGARSVGYISLDGLDTVATNFGDPLDYCHACFTGDYPTPYEERAR